MNVRACLGFLAIGLGALTSACGEAGASAGLEAAMDSVNGVPRFTYPAEGGTVLPWERDTTALVGEAFSDEDVYQFDRVPNGGIAGDAEGNLFVLDVAGSRVLSFDAEGRHRATVGRRGEGPGELAQPFGLALGAGDTIWVLDPLNGRFTGFPEGEGDPRVVNLSGLSGLPNPAFAVRPSGFLVQTTPPLRLPGGGEFRIGGMRGSTRTAPAGRAATPAAPRAEAPSGDGDEEVGEEPDNAVPILRVGFDGNVSTTVYRSPPPEMSMVQMGGSGGGSGGGRMVMMLGVQAAFTPTLRWAAFRDGGIAVSDKDRYEISLINPDGSQRAVIVRDMPVWPVTETEKEHARQQLRERRFNVNFGNVDVRGMIEQQVQNMTFAETVPRIAGLAIDPQERIWVGIALTTPGEVERIDLYSKEGEFLGSLDDFAIPDAFFPDGRAASLFRDPNTDIQRIAVYRVIENTPR